MFGLEISLRLVGSIVRAIVCSYSGDYNCLCSKQAIQTVAKTFEIITCNLLNSKSQPKI